MTHYRKGDVMPEADIQTMTNSEKIINHLKGVLGDKLRILLMPYKRDMWDSFEGVYKLAVKDPDIDVKVMPIPYTFKAPDGNIMQWFIDDFSDVVESRFAVEFQKYPEKGEYDAILIHNPYDECNYVTTLPKNFYSSSLKGLSRALCLIPYGIGTICLLTPGVMNADYVYAENEEVVQSFRYQIMEQGATAEEVDIICQKMILVGSPKYDLNLEQTVPEEWKERIKGKKVVLVASSLTAFLEDPDAEMERILNVINEFSEKEDHVVIWREHPLMKPTIMTMRPLLMLQYGAVQKRYIDEDIGIFDRTMDYRIAFSVADVLYSDPSSLVSVWAQTGKEYHVL